MFKLGAVCRVFDVALLAAPLIRRLISPPLRCGEGDTFSHKGRRGSVALAAPPSPPAAASSDHAMVCATFRPGSTSLPRQSRPIAPTKSCVASRRSKGRRAATQPLRTPSRSLPIFACRQALGIVGSPGRTAGGVELAGILSKKALYSSALRRRHSGEAFEVVYLYR